MGSRSTERHSLLFLVISYISASPNATVEDLHELPGEETTQSQVTVLLSSTLSCVRSSVEAEPFLKWAGGKRSVLEKFIAWFPQPAEGRVYWEPFLGGGAVFFAIRPVPAMLSDSNCELIDTYRTLRDDVDAVIRSLSSLRRSPDDYYRIRSSGPRSPHSRAARFIYLNKTCFNGLYRVNLKGEFNVPYGDHTPNLVICDEAQLRAASKALSSADIFSSDFEQAISEATSGDVVYFDPPYLTAHNQNGFIEYNARVFSWEDQRRLARVARELRARGVSVAISNADHRSIHNLYRSEEFEVHQIQRSSTMAGAPGKRFNTTELFIVGRPLSREAAP